MLAALNSPLIAPSKSRLMEEIDAADAHEMGMGNTRKFVGFILSAAPNAVRRKARIRGVLSGTIEALSPMAVSGMSLEDSLTELDALEAEALSAFQRARREMTLRRSTAIRKVSQ